MNKITLKARVVANEIDLNAIAVASGIPRKYTWEEPLVFRSESLETLLGSAIMEHSALYIFSFGSVVFINLTSQQETRALAYLKNNGLKENTIESSKYQDDYEIRLDETAEPQEQPVLNDKFVLLDHLEAFHVDLSAMVIAKSVALEKTEERLTEIMDGLEPLIDRLEEGKLRVSDKKLAQLSSKIARYEYTTLAYIMLLDKPDITWVNSEAYDFYDLMADFFELSDRYTVLKQKTELLNQIVENISSTSHTIKSIVIEVSVLILIAIEVVIMVIDLFK